MPTYLRAPVSSIALVGAFWFVLGSHSALAQSAPCRAVDLTSGGASQIQWAGFIDSPDIHCFDVASDPGTDVTVEFYPPLLESDVALSVEGVADAVLGQTFVSSGSRTQVQVFQVQADSFPTVYQVSFRRTASMPDAPVFSCPAGTRDAGEIEALGDAADQIAGYENVEGTVSPGTPECYTVRTRRGYTLIPNAMDPSSLTGEAYAIETIPMVPGEIYHVILHPRTGTGGATPYNLFVSPFEMPDFPAREVEGPRRTLHEELQDAGQGCSPGIVAASLGPRLLGDFPPRVPPVWTEDPNDIEGAMNNWVEVSDWAEILNTASGLAIAQIVPLIEAFDYADQMTLCAMSSDSEEEATQCLLEAPGVSPVASWPIVEELCPASCDPMRRMSCLADMSVTLANHAYLYVGTTVSNSLSLSNFMLAQWEGYLSREHGGALPPMSEDWRRQELLEADALQLISYYISHVADKTGALFREELCAVHPWMLSMDQDLIEVSGLSEETIYCGDVVIEDRFRRRLEERWNYYEDQRERTLTPSYQALLDVLEQGRSEMMTGSLPVSGSVANVIENSDAATEPVGENAVLVSVPRNVAWLMQNSGERYSERGSTMTPQSTLLSWQAPEVEPGRGGALGERQEQVGDVHTLLQCHHDGGGCTSPPAVSLLCASLGDGQGLCEGAVLLTGFNQRLRDFAAAGLNTSDAMTWASTQAQLLTGLANVPQSAPFPGITFGEDATGYRPVSSSGPSSRTDFVERLGTCQGEVWTNPCSWYSRIRGECGAC